MFVNTHEYEDASNQHGSGLLLKGHVYPS